jgi:hypothetical protein
MELFSPPGGKTTECIGLFVEGESGMWRSNPVCFCGLAVILLVLSTSGPVAAQGLQSTLHAGPRVFSAVGPGVAAIKRDSAGRYYILAQPATTISIYDKSGQLVGQIPNAHSHGAAIHYAVGFDIDAAGRVFVVDRGANAIKIFAPDGASVATIPVNTPTSVVALSGGQFAVTTLMSKRLVQIMDENGKVIRTFGDPADITPPAPAVETEDGIVKPPPPQATLVDRGRIVGDSDGNIYFSFTSLPDPTLQRFDRYGYSAYESVVPKETFGAPPRDSGRVELGYSMSALGWPTSISAWTDLHSLSSLSVSDRARRGMRGGSAASSGSSSSSLTDAPFGNITTQGNVLAFNTDGSTTDALDYSDSSIASLAPSQASYSSPDLMMPGMFGMGIGGFFHGHMPGLFSGGRPGGAGGPGGADSATAGRPDMADHPEGEDGHDHFHFHPGFDEYRARVAVRVRLDSPPPGADGKPVITAVGIDPVTHELWAAIGDTLVHFDSGGAREDMYYLLLTDGVALRPTSILVEPNRLLVAADPYGIYEFPRPDKPAPASTAASTPPASGSLVPDQITPAPKPHRRPLVETTPTASPAPAPQP